MACAIGAALAVLHAAAHGALAPPPLTDPSRWAEWVGERDPVEAAFALSRLVGFAIGWYALAVLIIGSALRRSGAARLVRVADLVTPVILRRLLTATATVSLVGIGPVTAATTTATTTTTTTPATATTAADADVPVMRLLPSGGMPTTSFSTSPPSAAPPAQSSPATDSSPTEPAPSKQWTVAPGQCFWSIADAVLANAWKRAPTDAEIVPYWLRLIEANRAALHDPANADLIFPGQVFTVPPP